jgi:mannose-6-phosphate isomerase
VTIEHACAQVVHKPWGSTDLRPWSEIHCDGGAIGELWYERADVSAPTPSLLLKLLFTTEALSIQVHPDDAFAHSIGLPHGKTEAWYILSAEPGAQVAIGLKRPVTAPQLRVAIKDGSIHDLVQWRPVAQGEVVFVAAGTIHAVGPGLVIAEIQQRSDTTFRLFDHGRTRELHVDNGVAAAHAGPAVRQIAPKPITAARTLLVTSPYFVMERLDFAPKTHWELHAAQETWMLILDGHAQVGRLNTFVGEAVYLNAQAASIKTDHNGMKCLLAYQASEPTIDLIRPRFPVHRFARPIHSRGIASSLFFTKEAYH